MLYNYLPQHVVPRLEALALSSNLLEMLIPGPHQTYESETLGDDAQQSVF